MSTENLTPDSKAVLLLCSTLALPRSGDAPKPLARSEWNDLARTIGGSALKRPAALFGLSSETLQQDLGIPDFFADRVATLLDRGGQLSIELERLQSLGIWVITRADANYPPLLKERLKAHAPPVLFGAGSTTALAQKGVASSARGTSRTLARRSPQRWARAALKQGWSCSPAAREAWIASP